MKQKISFELVYESDSEKVRVYRSSRMLKNNADGKLYREEPQIIRVYANKEKTKIKEITLCNEFDHVAISDALNHIERLAFPCWIIDPVVSDNPYFWLTDTIAGVNTSMMYGGDISSVKPDRVYLRMLAKGNGYQYTEGVSNE